LLNKPIVVISNGLTPTVFYWLNRKDLKYISPKQLKKEDLSNFKTVILVRYIPFKILFDLIKFKSNSGRSILLIDDNLLDFNIFSELPFLYKLKIFFNIYCYKFFLNFIFNEIWVTNKRLAHKVNKNIASNKIKIKLLTLSHFKPSAPKKLYKIAYLGTSSHTLELHWLKNLFEKIQLQRNDCLIEIYVSKKWRKYFRSIPRIKMIYPINWETFYMDTLIGKVDIVLNPVISSNFNIYRSPTKFFDTTRLDAVGIYSNIEPFADFINNNHDGILLDNDIELWNKKINYLLENLDLRNQLLFNAQKRIGF
tara:strand:+ start:1849 stop:2775 length:927 start_codon:yes stop_codon:yes gene_type:complete